MDLLLQNVVDPSSNGIGGTINDFTNTSSIPVEDDNFLPYFDGLAELQNSSNNFPSGATFSEVDTESNHNPFLCNADPLSEKLNFYEEYVSNYASSTFTTAEVGVENWADNMSVIESCKKNDRQLDLNLYNAENPISNSSSFDSKPPLYCSVTDISTPVTEAPLSTIAFSNCSDSGANFFTSTPPHSNLTFSRSFCPLPNNNFDSAGKCKGFFEIIFPNSNWVNEYWYKFFRT